jgi:hypothetical protein
MLQGAATTFDRMLAPVHRWIWGHPGRRVQKLLRFSATEIDGGRDILRASEVTSDPLLRRLYMLHAVDENRHGALFRRRAAALLRSERHAAPAAFEAGWGAPAGHGLDDLNVRDESDDTLLAFLHVAERSAANRFSVYRDVLHSDPATRAVFEEILHDEVFHMNYTLSQLVRVSPQRHRWQLWRARFTRLWKAYLRVAAAIGGAFGTVLLTIQYFVLLPPFAFLAKRAERREPSGWRPIAPERNGSLKDEY